MSSGGVDDPDAPSSSRSEMIHVPKAVFIEDVGAFLGGAMALIP